MTQSVSKKSLSQALTTIKNHCQLAGDVFFVYDADSCRVIEHAEILTTKLDSFQQSPLKTNVSNGLITNLISTRYLKILKLELITA